ncbi:discoidin domain-containing protein [Bifidobacterium samirii]|uniref:Peptidase M64 domain-containing protein n=1 Tax=Bifidobacterium samirii TaxID=2306974 RepID=A0A430FVQ1_9BIFI|nr:discoidin domain-containing protein [Bifidobacterium samirii]RSX58061.1 peptidase M64 domain-containing protein [Bifidobacterium samirii]
MTLHRRVKSLRGAAHRTIAMAAVSSLLAGTVMLAMPTPHVHADEAQLQQLLEQQLAEHADHADTVLDADDVTQDGAVVEYPNEDAETDGADGSDQSADAAGQQPADGGQDDAAAADDGTATVDESAGIVRANLSATPNWNTADYLARYQAPVTSYTASIPGFNNNYSIDKAFDNNWKSMYSAHDAGETVITMNFGKVEDLNRFLFQSHDSGSKDGYPTRFSIRASLTGDPDSYTDVITGYESEAAGQQLSFSFTTPFKAKSVQLVIHTAHNDGKARVAEIKWLRHDAVEEEVNSLFADAARTQLAEEWKSEEKLTALRERVEQHDYADTMIGYVERAFMILRGEWALNATLTRSTIKAGEGYDAEAYLKQFQTPVDVKGSTTSNPGQNGNEFEKAFDGDWNTRYFSTNTVPTTVTMKLSHETKVHRILYSTGQGNAHGYPNSLKISFSDTGHEGSFREVNASFSATADKVMFTLSEPVTATYVRFYFDGIHGGFNGFRYCASEIKVLGFDEVGDILNNKLFSDEARTKVADDYATTEALDALEARVKRHPNKNGMLGYIERARMILAGTWGLSATLTRTTIKAGEGYDSEAYLKKFKADVDVAGSRTSNAGSNGNELAKAFDGNWNTRYRATDSGTSTVVVKLSKKTKIHRILYATGEGNGYAYPTKLRIGFSDSGLDGSFQEASAAFNATGDKVMFTLSEPVESKYVSFNFGGEISGGFGQFRHAAAEIKVLEFDQTAYDVSDLFADELQHTLKDQYNNEEFLTDLQARVDAHPNKDSFANAMARAWTVFRGELPEEKKDRFDWPLYTVQKTGPDYQRAVWVILCDGYRAEERERAIKDVQNLMGQLMEREPYRSIASRLNIYAYVPESVDSGFSKYWNDTAYRRNTFFNSVRNPSVGGTYIPGQVQTAREYIQNNLLDKAPGTTMTQMMHATLLVNDSDYWGSGGWTSVASRGGGAFMISHEAAHFFAGLVDEYADKGGAGDSLGNNETLNDDPKTVRWREFLGLRRTGIYRQGANATGFTAYESCTMRDSYLLRFCEICRETVFRKINDWAKGDPLPMYVAQPQVTIVRTDQEKADGNGTGWDKYDKAGNAPEYLSGPEIGNGNITSANGRQLEYRTVVENFTSTYQDVTLKFSIVGADGTTKYAKEQTFSVRPNTEIPADVKPNNSNDMRQAAAQSLAITTDEAMSGLVDGDKIVASVVYDGDVLATAGDEYIANDFNKSSYATVNVAYKLVDVNGNVTGDVPYTVAIPRKLVAGEKLNTGLPEIYGYSYLRTTADDVEIDNDTYSPEAGTTVNVVHYYRENSAMVTKRLVDVNGLLISETSSRVVTGATVTPVKGDFTVGEGYVIDVPDAVTVGSEDVTLTYTVRKGSDVTNAALGSTVKAYNPDGTPGFERESRPLKIGVDGKKDSTDSYGDFSGSDNKAASYAEFDLGGTYELMGEGDDPTKDVIRLWRYWGDARVYKNTVIVASEKGTFEDGDYTVLYNADADNKFGFGIGTATTYGETQDGLHVDVASGVRASRIRVYMNGSNKNQSNHIVEFEAMGRKLDLTYNTELEQMIDELSAKVESGLYTEMSAAAARTAIESARRKLVAGVGVDDMVAIRTQFEAAEKKLRVKDASDGVIQFLGGSLRYSDSAASSLDGLRVGFGFIAPKGAEIVWSKTGWHYGRSADGLDGFKAVERYVTKDGQYVANLVLTDIPADKYGMILYTRAQLTYRKDGKETTITASSVNSRSVEGVAGKIMNASGATDDERELATAILEG